MNKVEIKEMYKKFEEESLEMRDDTQQFPFGAPTIVEQAKLVDAVIQDNIEKALKYIKVDKEENAKKREVISLFFFIGKFS